MSARLAHLSAVRRRKAFTLVELVVVVVIIAVLSAIALVGYTAMVANSRKGAMRASGAQIGKILQAESASSQGLVSASVCGPMAASTCAANITVGGQALSAGAQADVVAAAGPGSQLQTASYGVLVSNPSWSGGSCTVLFAAKAGESPAVTCGQVLSAAGNLISGVAAASFEDGTTGTWLAHTRAVVTNSTDVAYHGTSSLKVSTSAGGTYAQAWIPAVPTPPAAGTAMTYVGYLYTSTAGMREPFPSWGFRRVAA